MKKKETIFQLLTQKPWDPSQAKIDDLHKGETLSLSKGKLGLRFIMIVSSIFFCLFIITYADRMVYADWKKMPEPLLLWFNTLILILSSVLFISAQINSNKNNFKKAKNNLILIGFFAIIFLLGQLLVWKQFIDLGYFLSTNPANAYFYLFSTLHGIHLIGGLFYWNIALQKVWNKNEIMIIKAKQTIELCAIYWHFLLIVWLVLFSLMLLS